MRGCRSGRSFANPRVKGFSRWLWRDGRAREDALAHLTPPNPDADPRHARGVLTREEFDALIRATRPATPFRGLSGYDRSLLYVVASYTGLRASELASLTPSGFDLDADPPVVRVQAGYTKNGEEAVVPLRPDLCERLRSYFSGRDRRAPLWPGSWVGKAAKMLRGDLERAGVPYVDGDGRYRDFHSLRHRFGSELARANVPPKVAQELMRHSTIVLTMDRYSHVGLHDTAGALDKLPPLPGHGASTEAARMTGTDAITSDTKWQRSDSGTGRDGADSGGSGGMTRQGEGSGLPQVVALDGSRRDVTEAGEVHPAGLEPATYGSEDRCSIQLSYGCPRRCVRVEARRSLEKRTGGPRL